MQGGWTALHRAADAGDEAEAEAAIAADPSSIEALTAGYRETPLHLAIRNNRLACVKLLVEAGASTSLEYGAKGDTALTLAQRYKFRPIIEYLSSKGATAGEASKKPLYPCLNGECTYGV